YLSYRDAQRFGPDNMMAIVYNRALAAYIAELLPALGVQNARIEVFEAFEEALRRRHFPDMPETYSDNTPLSVIRFKQHPAALAMLEQAQQRLAGELRESIAAAVQRTPSETRALEAWDSLAGELLLPRAQRFAQWVRTPKAILPGLGAFGDDWLARQRLRKLSDEWPVSPQQAHQWPLAIWSEAFLRKEPLQAALEDQAPGAFSAGQVADIHVWALAQYQRRDDYRAWKQDGRPAGDEEDGPQAQPPEPPAMDREDDTLLLLLYTRMVGPLRGRRQKPLQVQHLMIDEAQDFGPLDLRLMFGLVQAPPSVTLAGDTSQRMILHNGFDSWEDVLRHLGLQGTPISPLRIGYRSTAEIMRFARAVLGPLADERPWIPTRKGVPVELFRFTDTGQAAMMLSGALRELQRHEPNANVAIVARYPAQAELFYAGLQKTDIPRVRRVREQDFSFKPGIEVTDVVQVKGLEFDYVILIDVDAPTYPDDTASRYLLHIGATRAAHQLWLMTARAPSPLIPPDIAPRYF
ncbi:MAG TPA: ATP-binding domain-containing protein, partial [bacterium]